MSKNHKNSRKFRQSSPIEDLYEENESFEDGGEMETSQPRAQKSIESIRPLKASSSAAAWILLIALVLFTVGAFFK